MNESLFRSKVVTLAIVALAFLLPAVAFSQSINAAAAAQINDILAQKRQFTAAQSKMDSSLVFAAALARGDLAGKSFAGIVAAPKTDAGGLVVVDIKGTVSDIVAQVAAQGGQVVSQFPTYGAVRARMPLQNIEALADSPSVTSVSTEQKALVNVGALTSEGYIAHSADQVVKGLGINGSGMKVGVLSDSASAAGVAALIASGDLGPNTTVLPGQAGPTPSQGGTDEGTAMMEIVQDLAPGAQLFFATAETGVAAFASNILALAAAGCTIIVDDVTYFNEGVFQDGPIAQAVNTFVAGGGLYFSSAANSGNLTNGTSGTWEGDFADGGASTLETGRVHSFGPQNYNVLTAPTSFLSVKWSDPLGASSNDYDLFVLNSSGTAIKGFSVSSQTGTQDPYEAIGQGSNCGTSTASGYCPASGDHIVVVQYSGAARALHIDTERGQLSIGTTGATFGHNAGANTISVAATFWNSAKTGVVPFNGLANPTESFSSDGPRRVFYTPSGTPVTPGKLTFGTNGGTSLQKPDVTAADGVSAHTPGFFGFFGTSAAAPHAAGVATLVWSAKPSLTNTQVKSILLNTALPITGPGWNRDGGFGVVMALGAVQIARAQQ